MLSRVQGFLSDAVNFVDGSFKQLFVVCDRALNVVAAILLLIKEHHRTKAKIGLFIKLNLRNRPQFVPKIEHHGGSKALKHAVQTGTPL